jgi:hypothetical protein
VQRVTRWSRELPWWRPWLSPWLSGDGGGTPVFCPPIPCPSSFREDPRTGQPREAIEYAARLGSESPWDNMSRRGTAAPRRTPSGIGLDWEVAVEQGDPPPSRYPRTTGNECEATAPVGNRQLRDVARDHHSRSHVTVKLDPDPVKAEVRASGRPLR